MQTLLGVVIGLLLAIIVFLATKRYEIPIKRTFKQAENLVKEKGEIFIEDENVENLKEWLNNLPNDKN